MIDETFLYTEQTNLQATATESHQSGCVRSSENTNKRHSEGGCLPERAGQVQRAHQLGQTRN